MKIENEQEQKRYQEKFQEETREYEQFSRTNFFMKVFEGRIPVQDIYEEAAKLSLKINASGYNLVMFALLEKKEGIDSGFESETFARKRDELLRYFVRYPEHIVFRWNINTYGVLIKGNPEQMQELTDRCLGGIERICGAVEGALDWYAAGAGGAAEYAGRVLCFGQSSVCLSLPDAGGTYFYKGSDGQLYAHGVRRPDQRYRFSQGGSGADPRLFDAGQS